MWAQKVNIRTEDAMTHVISSHSIVTTSHLPHPMQKTHVNLHHSTSLPVSHESTPHSRSRTHSSPPPQPNMEDWKEAHFLMPNPLECFTKLISLQADLIYNCLVSLFSPVVYLLSIVHESYLRAEEAQQTVESAVLKVPSTISHGSTLLLKKLSFGFLGAAYVCMILMTVLVLAIVVGVGLVQLWVDHPVFVRERLYFDYTEAYPTAVFYFGDHAVVERNSRWKQSTGVPIGHTFHVSLALLMPDSDFNREIGVFQLSAELLSVNGNVIAKSSHPSMLQYRSFPIRFARTFLMSVPLLLGISSETQKISIEILKHKEGRHRTEAIRVILVPRAGTSSPPQLYEAQLFIHSQLPWAKQLVHNWKWTLYVWTSLYIYIILLILLLCCCKPLIFPMTTANLSDHNERALIIEEPVEAEIEAREEREVSELLRRWKRSRSRSRSKRKAIYLQEAMLETIGSSTSSISVTREDTSTVIEDIGDSESVC